MLATYEVRDEVSSNLLFTVPWVDHGFREGDIFTHDDEGGVIKYKVESSLMALQSYPAIPGVRHEGFHNTIITVKVTVVP